jgi:hypothetical protein
MAENIISISNSDGNLSDTDAYQDTSKSSDTVYQFQDNWGNATIFDKGGSDTLDFSNLSGGVVVNLLAGTSSAGLNTLSWVNGTTTFEKVIGSNYADTIYGGNNGSGKGVIDGRGGDDCLYGYNGKDVVIGGTGNDNMYGGHAPDTYVFGHITQAVVVPAPEYDGPQWLLDFADSVLNPPVDPTVLPGQTGGQPTPNPNDGNAVTSPTGIEAQLQYDPDGSYVDGSGDGGYFFDPNLKENPGDLQGVEANFLDALAFLQGSSTSSAPPLETDIIDDASGDSDVLDFSAVGGISLFDSWTLSQDGADLDILMGNGGHLLSVVNYFALDGLGQITGLGQGAIETFHFNDGDLSYSDVLANLA